MIQTPGQKKRAAFFDLDLTLTYRDCFRLFLMHFYFERVSRLLYLPYLFYIMVLRKVRLITLKSFKEKAMKGLKGLTKEEIREIGTLFFKRSLKSVLRRQALEKIRQHQKKGDLVFIISASPDIYVHEVSRFLGCDGYACTRLDFVNKRFDGHIKGKDCLGKEKQARMYSFAKKYKIDLGVSSAYSDHESDIIFLKTAGKKIVVTPTRVLNNIARANDWEIVNW